jgi:hypothetical protein
VPKGHEWPCCCDWGCQKGKNGSVTTERGPFPFMNLVGIPVVALVVAGIERITHNDVLAAFATLVLMGAYLGWWFWRHRYL